MAASGETEYAEVHARVARLCNRKVSLRLASGQWRLRASEVRVWRLNLWRANPCDDLWVIPVEISISQPQSELQDLTSLHLLGNPFCISLSRFLSWHWALQ